MLCASCQLRILCGSVTNVQKLVEAGQVPQAVFRGIHALCVMLITHSLWVSNKCAEAG
jgi:hypothetical protein